VCLRVRVCEIKRFSVTDRLGQALRNCIFLSCDACLSSLTASEIHESFTVGKSHAVLQRIKISQMYLLQKQSYEGNTLRYGISKNSPDFEGDLTRTSFPTQRNICRQLLLITVVQLRISFQNITSFFSKPTIVS